MASTRAWLLLLERDSWRIIDSISPEDGSESVEFSPGELPDQASGIIEQLKDRGHMPGAPLFIGLDSSECLSPTVAIPTPQLLRKPQALHYHLEQWIPWSAEEYVVDVVGHRDQAFTVAYRHETISELLEALTAEDISVPVIAPVALLALDASSSAETLSGGCLLYCQQGDHVDVFELKEGKLFGWAYLPSEPIAVCQHHLQRLLQFGELPSCAQNLSPEILAAWDSQGIEYTKLTPQDQQSAAIHCCTKLAAGDCEPLVNLRTGELAAPLPFQATKREFSRVKVAVMLLLISLATLFWQQRNQYVSAKQDLDREIAEVHQSLFPGQPVPERPAVAIRKEYRRLQGTRAPSSDLPVPVSADLVLARLLEAFPDKMRYRFTEIRIERSSIYLAGEVRSNADADRVATTLRSQEFEVSPPRTQRLDEKGFSLRLDGKAKHSKKAKDS